MGVLATLAVIEAEQWVSYSVFLGRGVYDIQVLLDVVEDVVPDTALLRRGHKNVDVICVMSGTFSSLALRPLLQVARLEGTALTARARVRKEIIALENMSKV